MDQKVASIWSTPKLAPMYPPFPIRYKNVTILTTVYRTDPAAIEKHIDYPVESNGDLVMIHNYYMPIVEGMGEVEETNVMIGVKVKAGGVDHFGGFSTNLLISSEVGLTQGREIHGQPKKMGSTKIKIVNNEIVAEVFRGNALISRVVMPVSSQAAQVSELEKYFPFRENINHKVIRNIDGTQGINQITSRILGDVVVKECWRGPSKLTIEFNESAPFHLLPVLETVESFYWKADFALVPGTILHDYLKAGI
ncbi:putative acetoacetate decarboxylase 2 [Actinomycetes bacterium]|nr:putative acetoacetate decarboxylase 2 [Actinomycetes bacterium]